MKKHLKYFMAPFIGAGVILIFLLVWYYIGWGLGYAAEWFHLKMGWGCFYECDQYGNAGARVLLFMFVLAALAWFVTFLGWIIIGGDDAREKDS